MLGTGVLGTESVPSSPTVSTTVPCWLPHALDGEAVVFIPGRPSGGPGAGWFATMKKELEPLGVSVTVRDPTLTRAPASAIETWCDEAGRSGRPEARTCGPTRSICGAPRERAASSLIHSICARPMTRRPSSGWIGSNRRKAHCSPSLKACEGSRKIAILQVPLSAAAARTLEGVERVAKNSQLSVVSNQAADWDASKAKAITQTVLKQHPDLCGIIGFWDGQDIGTAPTAIKEAGLTGKVFLITSGGSEQKGACDMVKSSAYDMYISYRYVPDQGRDVSAVIKWLLQSGVKAGTAKGSIYTTLNTVTKANVDGACWTLGM